MGKRERGFVLAGVCTLALLPVSAWAQNGNCVNDGAGVFVEGGNTFTIDGGQVNGAGATLFVDFFFSPTGTNDFVDVDGDLFAGFDPDTFPFVDQLAAQYTPNASLSTWWLFNYRSVGSVRGFNQFVESSTCGIVPISVTSEAGIFNGFTYSDDSGIQWAGPFANASGTPFEQCEIEFAFLDVPGSYAVQIPGDPAWFRTPGAPGYGLCPVPSSNGSLSQLQSLSRDCGTCSVSGDPCIVGRDIGTDGGCSDPADVCNPTQTVTLNLTTQTPNPSTVFDVPGAYVPVSIIGNRGTGVAEAKYTELQHHFVAGRFPNGENFVGATRDVGSGTRNAAMNSLGIDTSWGRGDNIGSRVNSSSLTALGPGTQPSNCGGSSIMESSVQNRRLAIGYTGLAGGSRSANDVLAGRYEIIGTCKDVPATGQAACDCDVTGYVRPGVDTTLDNCDPCNSYQVAGIGSFSFLGNPAANRQGKCSVTTTQRCDVDGDCPGGEVCNPDPLAEPGSQPMDNQAVADYINNILDSIAAFSGNVENDVCLNTRVCSGDGTTICVDENDCPMGDTCDFKACGNDNDCDDPNFPDDLCRSNANMPGQFLATEFFLPAGLDCINDLPEPLRFINVDTNQALQDFIRANNVITVDAWGTVTDANLVPLRNALPFPGIGGGPSEYADGSVNGDYRQKSGAGFTNLSSGNELAARNEIHGDFNNDGMRNANDAAELVNAYYTPRAWQLSGVAQGGGNSNGQVEDNAIPEMLGDFNGDGNLTKEDLRYFADGLAMVPGASGRRLDRKVGATNIDMAIMANAQPFPWADTRAQLIEAPAVIDDEPTFLTPADIAGFHATGKTYEAGDFRGDVAGGNPNAGGNPTGWDGQVNDADIDYVCANIGDWSNLNEAVFLDLSADMNGDTQLTLADQVELVEVILGTELGDANLDGVRDATDDAIAQATIDAGAAGCNGDASCGWADGDYNCDGIVDGSDLNIGLGLEPALANNIFDVLGGTKACTSDADCQAGVTGPDAQTVCRSGECYVARGRALSIRPNPANAGGNYGYRVSLDTGVAGTAVLGFVGAPSDETGNNGPGPNAFSLSRIVDTPDFRDWSTISTAALTIADCEVSFGNGYVIQTIAEGDDLGSEASYSAPLNLPTSQFNGDVTGGGSPGDPPNGAQGSLVDVFAIVLGFQGNQNEPLDWLDTEPNVGAAQPNLIVNLADAFAGVQAFQGNAYPGPAPLDCP
ncbi:MAG: hypothetical protein ACPGXK_08255 [Phycisphaerae bacterium]